jgi:DNA-binding MarR family transcriptional regulator
MPQRAAVTSRSKVRNRDEPPEYPLWLLKRAWQSGHRAISEAIRVYDITPTQVGALNHLLYEPGLSGADLARRLLVTPQAAQLALTALDRRGLIERKPDPNHGRIVRTYLTPEGRRVTRLSMNRSLKAENQYLAVLNEDERNTLIGFLNRLAKQGINQSPSGNGYRASTQGL